MVRRLLGGKDNEMNDVRKTEQTNVDRATARGFGDEWSRFDQSDLAEGDHRRIFDEYFSIFPSEALNPDAVGADFGVGSGRWAMVVAPMVGHLICLDASEEALAVAKRNLVGQTNCSFQHRTVNDADIARRSLDFAYSLGVLHHVPDTRDAMRACVEKLKPGAPFLVYLYYRFDNKPAWYALLWSTTELARRILSRLPYGARYWSSQVLAVVLYWPLARTARLFERIGRKVDNFPLAYYRDKPFYVMRTDALDRFGTRLEQRFTRGEIETMMRDCGLTRITFSERPPYWCAVGYRMGA